MFIYFVSGRDLEPGCHGGTWMAMSPKRNRIGALLNLPKVKNPKAKSKLIIFKFFTSIFFNSHREHVNHHYLILMIN